MRSGDAHHGSELREFVEAGDFGNVIDRLLEVVHIAHCMIQALQSIA